VGVAFVVASLAATGPALQRVLVAAVGAAWLIGSIFVSALSVHQAVLALALLAFPVGRIRGILRLLLGAGAFVIGAGVVPQLGLAAFFAAVGVGIYATVARTAVAAYPTFAAVAVAAIGSHSDLRIAKTAVAARPTKRKTSKPAHARSKFGES